MYWETSVSWSACEVVIGSQMVVVVETRKVVVEKCAGKASDSMPKSEETAWMETAVVYVACQDVPM